MADWLVILAAGLSVFRLTRLIVRDDFPPVRFFRNVIVNWSAKSPRREWAGDLVTCHWCASAYVAGVLTLLYWQWPIFTVWLLRFLAAWAIGSLIADIEAQSKET